MLLQDVEARLQAALSAVVSALEVEEARDYRAANDAYAQVGPGSEGGGSSSRLNAWSGWTQFAAAG